jgi:hypothetical protein
MTKETSIPRSEGFSHNVVDCYQGGMVQAFPEKFVKPVDRTHFNSTRLQNKDLTSDG